MDLRFPARRARRTHAVCLLPLLAGVAAAHPQGAANAVETLPAPLNEYMGRPVAPTMHWRGAEWLLRETRESEEHSSRLLAALGVEPGDTVCDLGSGVGYLTLPLAELVGETGEVIAVDIQPEMLEGLQQRAREAGVGNIRPVLGGPADPRLEPGSCDLVLMVDVYHELGYPEQVLAVVRQALKPGGRLVLVEFRAEDPEVPIKPEHKMGRAQVERELVANGFRLASSFDELPWQHLLCFASADEDAQDPDQGGFFDQFEEAEHDGAWLYERNCSGCHGPTGAGDGPTARELGVQPRDFNQGGFSFGNTREAMFRTVSSGIPGRSVMPSFAGTLSEAERWRVVDHVRTLMPPQPEEDTRASVLEVTDRPVVARGKLPPLAEGLPEHPRGLLLGLPSGLTFEYDAEDVRLLAVRMGPFADREDWRARGGGYLRPLGQPIYLLDGGDPRATYRTEGVDTLRSLAGQLLSTRTTHDALEISFALRERHSPEHVYATVTERCSFVATRAGAGFRREFRLDARIDPATAGIHRQVFVRPAGSGNVDFEPELKEVAAGSAWWLIGSREDGAQECLLLEAGSGVEVWASPEGPVFSARLGPDVRADLAVTVILTRDARPEDLSLLAEEALR